MPTLTVLAIASSYAFAEISPLPSLLLSPPLGSPRVISSSPRFNSSYNVVNLSDSRIDEYATAGVGVGAFVTIDFVQTERFDRVVLVTRKNISDVVGRYKLEISADTTFDSSDSSYEFEPAGSNGQGTIYSFPATTGRYLKWSVVTSTGVTQNLGGMELRFLRAPINSVIAEKTVIGGATPFNVDYGLSFASDGKVGTGAGNEYASQGQGLNTFVDFDFGIPRTINGFDFFDRLSETDRIEAFNLIFSNDPTFPASASITQSYFLPNTESIKSWGYSKNFVVPGNFRYVRFDVTAIPTVGPPSTNNLGMAEMIFYAQNSNVADSAIIKPIAARSSSRLSVNNSIAQLLDGSGLVAPFNLSASHTSNSTSADMWVSGNEDGGKGGPLGITPTPSAINTQVLEFEFNQEFDFSELYIWNYNTSGKVGQGIKDFQIWTSSGPSDNYVYAGKYTLDLGLVSPASNQAQPITITAKQARYVQLRILTNHGDPTYVGLSEIRFVGTAGSKPDLQVLSQDDTELIVNGSLPIDTHEFGIVNAGGTVTKRFNLKNMGFAPLTINSIGLFSDLSPTSQALFAVGNLMGGTSSIKYLEKRTFDVTYSPFLTSVNEQLNTYLSIASNDPNELTTVAKLSTNPKLPSTFYTTTLPLKIPDNSAAGVSIDLPVSGLSSSELITHLELVTGYEPRHENVGDLKVVLQSPAGVEHTIFDRPNGADDSDLLGNYGFTDTSLLNFSTEAQQRSGSEVLRNLTYRTTNTSGDVTSMRATFAGMTGAAANGIWRVIFYDLNADKITELSQVKLNITTGNAPQISVEDASGNRILSSRAIKFDEVVVGQSLAKTFTIRNLGNRPLTGIVATVGTNTRFAISSAPANTIAPGASTTVTVECVANQPADYNDILTISSDDATEPNFTIALNATGVSPFVFATLSGSNIKLTSPTVIPNSALLLAFDVNHLSGKINDMRLSMTLSHSESYELDATLNSPQSTTNALDIFKQVGRTGTYQLGSGASFSGTYSFSDLGTGNIWNISNNAGEGNIDPGILYRTSTGGSGNFTSMLSSFGANTTTTLNGTWLLRLIDVFPRTGNFNEIGTISGAKLHIGTTPQSYAEWRALNFSAADFINLSVSGPLAEPNQDGTTNVFAYLFGSLPMSSVGTQLPMVRRVGSGFDTFLEISHNRPAYLETIPTVIRPGQTRINYEISDDLINWANVTPVSEVVGTSNSNGATVTTTIRIPNNKLQYFARVKATSD